MHLEILLDKQKELFSFLRNHDFLEKESFCLFGGTGLALQIGHRVSYDFDFITHHSFNPHELINKLPFKKFTITQIEKDTLSLNIDDVKISFFGNFTYPTITPPISYEKINIYSILDIAAMKIFAMLKRNTLRDYFDIAYILHEKIVSLDEIMKAFYQKYQKKGELFQENLILKTLSYTQDIKKETISLTKKSPFWTEKDIITPIKRSIEEAVNQYIEKTA